MGIADGGRVATRAADLSDFEAARDAIEQRHAGEAIAIVATISVPLMFLVGIGGFDYWFYWAAGRPTRILARRPAALFREGSTAVTMV